jgi:hypothetical protein
MYVFLYLFIHLFMYFLICSFPYSFIYSETRLFRGRTIITVTVYGLEDMGSNPDWSTNFVFVTEVSGANPASNTKCTVDAITRSKYAGM